MSREFNLRTATPPYLYPRSFLHMLLSGVSWSFMSRSTFNQFLVRDEINSRIRTIPKKNKQKFTYDLLTLIQLAHGDNYENIEITENRN